MSQLTAHLYSCIPINFKSLRLGVSLLDLPNDVFLDNIFTRIDIQDIIVLRRVNRRLYELTHEAVIWKRLLRQMNIPLPPLPPTPRYSIASLNNLEVERLLVRAVSLKKNLDLARPEPFFSSVIETFHHVQSMAILPGGKYLVASVREEQRESYAIMVFALDYRRGGTLPLAKLPTPTKAYNLQADYMTYQHQKGIMISYILREAKLKKDKLAAGGVRISQLSHETVLDINFPLVHTCTTVFVALGAAEKLSDPDLLHPGSDDYNKYAMAQSPPFRFLAEIRSSSALGHISMDIVFGLPYMAVVKGKDKIMFKNLALDGFSTITCPPFQAGEDLTIEKIRLLPNQSSIFVVRKLQGKYIVFEIYPIPSIGQHVNAPTPNRIALNYPDPDQIEISKHEILSSYHGVSDPDAPPRVIDNWSRTLSVYVTLKSDPQSKRYQVKKHTIFAARFRDDNELPIVPFPVRSALEKDPAAKKALIKKYATHKYVIENKMTVQGFDSPQDHTRLRVIPSENFPLLYWTEETIKDCPKLSGMALSCRVPLDPSEPKAPPQVVDGDMGPIREWMRKQEARRIKFPLMFPELSIELGIWMKPLRCIAWDDSIGRICLVHDNDPRIHIVDFSQAPMEDMNGERIHMPVRTWDNPKRSHVFGGNIFWK